jgi:uncharacterized membrane protein
VQVVSSRWRAVDTVRGLVIALMALDHIRDFLGTHDATELVHRSAPLFATRWITHFCAPTFFLLAGTSAYLSIESGRRTRGEAARFLLVRGAALVVVEQTLLRCFGWYFHFDYHFMNAGVLYGLGLAMMMLSALLWLPPLATAGLGLAIIVGESAVARLELGTLGDLLMRSRDFEPVADYHFFVSYPPIPWLGAMALGYALPRLTARRPRWLVALGLAFLAAFVALRAGGVGDAEPWEPDLGVQSFVNVSKYPPSTAFLLLTLGGALIALAAFERWPRARVLDGFGRVPLFFYLLHIPLIHALAVVYSWLAFGAVWWLTSGPVVFWDTALPGSPADYGLSLGAVYLVWIALLAAMYPLCRWYDAARASRKRSLS